MSNFREEYEKTYGPMRAARKPISQELHDKLVALCQRNCWLKRHGLAFMDDPCLEADSPYDPAEGAYFPFESVTMKLVIARGEFETLLADMQAATVAQCKHLDYAGRSKCHE